MERRKWATPSTTRSRVVLEVASELAGLDSWTHKQAFVNLRVQGDASSTWSLIGSDTPAAIDMVAKGQAHIAIINPAGPLAVALRGSDPFREPIPLRAIGVIPSYDQLALAVSESTGLTSLEQIKDRKFPLRLSLRGQPDHSVRFYVDQICAVLGFTLEDLTSWGGSVSYDPGFNFARRLAAVQRGEVDAMFDEAVDNWVGGALDVGMRVLPIEGATLAELERRGFGRSVLRQAEYPKLPGDVSTLDFSGWTIFTLDSAPDDLIAAFCSALEARKDRVPWQGEGPLPLERMCRDSREGPLNIPLHPAAERFSRERGYL